MQLASVRLTAAMAVMIGFAVSNIRHIPRAKLPFVVISALFSMFIPAYLFCLAQKGLNSSIVGVLNAMTPAFTFIVGIAFFRQKARWLQALGLLIGFIGCTLLILVNAKGDLSLNAYSLYVMLATLCYGFNTNIVKRHLQEVNAIHLTTVAVSISGLLALTHLLSDLSWVDLSVNTAQGRLSLFAGIALGVIGTAISQLIFNRLLMVSSAVFASSITYFIPIVAVMWGLYDGEVLLPLHLLGMALIIAGILIINKTR